MDFGTLILVAVFGLAIFFAVGYFFLRWVFEVEKNTKLQEKQVKLLREIAEKQGVPHTAISDILR